MERIGFKMQLHNGCEDEYKKRHDELWPELQLLLKDAGIQEYSIFLDEETNSLFGTLLITDSEKLELLRNEPIMKKWWLFMSDIMDTNDDYSPVTTALKEVFYMP
jgi:L-rhamnose mutarotase